MSRKILIAVLALILSLVMIAGCAPATKTTVPNQPDDGVNNKTTEKREGEDNVVHDIDWYLDHYAANRYYQSIVPDLSNEYFLCSEDSVIILDYGSMGVLESVIPFSEIAEVKINYMDENNHMVRMYDENGVSIDVILTPDDAIEFVNSIHLDK